jgi:hypothetical protein
MSDISVADVVFAIHQMMERPRGPLAVETVEIGTDSPKKPYPRATGSEGVQVFG